MPAAARHQKLPKAAAGIQEIVPDRQRSDGSSTSQTKKTNKTAQVKCETGTHAAHLMDEALCVAQGSDVEQLSTKLEVLARDVQQMLEDQFPSNRLLNLEANIKLEREERKAEVRKLHERIAELAVLPASLGEVGAPSRQDDGRPNGPEDRIASLEAELRGGESDNSIFKRLGQLEESALQSKDSIRGIVQAFRVVEDVTARSDQHWSARMDKLELLIKQVMETMQLTSSECNATASAPSSPVKHAASFFRFTSEKSLASSGSLTVPCSPTSSKPLLQPHMSTTGALRQRSLNSPVYGTSKSEIAFSSIPIVQPRITTGSTSGVFESLAYAAKSSLTSPRSSMPANIGLAAVQYSPESLLRQTTAHEPAIPRVAVQHSPESFVRQTTAPEPTIPRVVASPYNLRAPHSAR